MYDNLTEFFENLIEQTGSYDIAQSEFEKIADEDTELKESYIQWCDDNGFSPRNGFKNFCEQYHDERNSAMDSLNEDIEW